jgi:hypothetical protein
MKLRLNEADFEMGHAVPSLRDLHRADQIGAMDHWNAKI